MSSALDFFSGAATLSGVITPAQIRAARGLLNLTQADVARLTGLSTTGFNNIERGRADPKASTLSAIQRAFEEAGVEFIPENGGGPGVRLRGRSSLPKP